MTYPVNNKYKNLSFSSKIRFAQWGWLILIKVGIAILVLTQLSFSSATNPEIREIILKNSNEFKNQIGTLVDAAHQFLHNKTTLKSLKTELQKTRNSYKKIECITEYYFPKHVKNYINGPPLYHLDPFPIDQDLKENYYVLDPESYRKSLPLDKLNTDHYKGTAKVIAPVGLQVLDEIIYSEEVHNKKEEIFSLCNQLKEYYIVIDESFNKRKYFYDFEILEALRLQLVRIFTLGITGFDTPGSLNAMQEASSSLQSLKTLSIPFLNKVDSSKKAYILSLYEEVIYLLKDAGFENFDRLTFLTKYINPLYKELLNVQLDLDIKSSDEMYTRVSAWNPYSSNIFDIDFLNPYKFSLLQKNNDSEALKALGEKLFYDKTLSGKENISCASCHKPELAFTDGVAKSKAGIKGKSVHRNAPTLINAVFSDRFFYDLRAHDLEEQAEHVIHNNLEFNTSFDEIITKLNKDEYYKKAFKKVFNNTSPVTRYQFSSALASYIISLRSFNSTFDKYVQGKSNKVDPLVKKGFNLFMGKANCGTCHYPPTFSGLVPPLYEENETEVLGVLNNPDSHELDNDMGRFANNVFNEKQEIYRRSFKTTTVRNITLTAPYFHNGAYRNLDEVLEFYNNGGAGGLGLSYEFPNQTLSDEPLLLSKKEIKALKIFLNSLTDITGFQ
ncbi:cytochrome-c peroxidase [Abyssalbus ytuae]|uniref:Cytochrome-c peroxidase n=1 Tax=Abyssalbus ytuae TaxID=2926907 RepID=A0A9E7D303_9FLAO|nr:cytochrome c peroxidase [Abyssalbus ytuae]UOB17274.1 cytochrome-c peroxidase [Abyssalbus ytuae]